MRYVSPNAKDLIKLIGREYHLQSQRAVGGFINEEQVLAITVERLNGFSGNNPALREFLSRVAPVPKEEDEDPNTEWAEDPRESRDNCVEHRLSTPRALKRDNTDEWHFPLPDERIA